MKKKISILTVLLLLILIIALSLLLHNNKISNKTNNTIDVYEKSIDTCNENIACPYGTMTYKNVHFNFKSQVLKNLESEINNAVNNVYEVSLQSKMDSSSCDSYMDVYKHSVLFYNTLEIYQDSKIIVILLNIDPINVCNDGEYSHYYKTYYYDIENDKLLSNEQIMDKLGISTDLVVQSIKRNIDLINRQSSNNYSFQDVVNYNIYFDYEGIGYVIYTCSDNNYYTAELGISLEYDKWLLMADGISEENEPVQSNTNETIEIGDNTKE